MTTEAEKRDAIERISMVILETVQEAGLLGAPGGHLYAALSMCGMTLNQFQQFMAGLTELGCLTHEFECYKITDKGVQYLARLQKTYEKAA